MKNRVQNSVSAREVIWRCLSFFLKVNPSGRFADQDIVNRSYRLVDMRSF